MWLLRTDTAELHYFARNFDASGGYAILSHTWEGPEQTFQELRDIIKLCGQCRTNPRDFVHPKIRNCCILAEKNGYRWLWIDSCCIDKTSSSELSEAINSMYQWYREAEVCFAYLADVPRDCVLHAPNSAFRKSRWHTRGWTLQELIAPDFLVFLSDDWHELGNRAALAELLRDIAGVPSEVLTGEGMPAENSVCIRMSWASKRKTTRVEDEAYCLMGLFGVSMPTNYGEGKQVFIRLQYEIMQHNSDMSLFAFGYRIDQGHNFTFHPQETPNSSWMYLMADSPREFNQKFTYLPALGTKAVQQYPPLADSNSTTDGPFDDIELPRATAMSYGMKLRLPIYEANGITIAMILCQYHGRNVGLFLTRDSRGKDPKRPRYFTGCGYSRPNSSSTRFVARMVDLGTDFNKLTFGGKRVKASWRTIYVVPTASDFGARSTITPNLIMNCKPTSRFHVPRWLIARFVTLRFSVSQLRDTEALQAVKIFHYNDSDIIVLLGSCTATGHQDHDQPLSLYQWARVDVVSNFNEDTYDFTHNCSEDHIGSKSWAMRSKVFGDANRKVRLSFTPSTRMSENVLVVHLELFGRVFERMLRDADISFPSLADLEKDTPLPTPSHTATSIPLRILARDVESMSAAPPPSNIPKSTRDAHEAQDAQTLLMCIEPPLESLTPDFALVTSVSELEERRVEMPGAWLFES